MNPSDFVFIFVIFIALVLLFFLTKEKPVKKSSAKKTEEQKKVQPLVEKVAKKTETIVSTEEEQPSEERFSESFIKIHKKFKNFDKEKNNKFNKKYRFISLRKRRQLPYYKESLEAKKLMGRMQFVKTSKTVSKLVRRDQMLKMPDPAEIERKLLEEQLKQEQQNLLAQQEEANKSKYFNKSRRISKYISENDYDSLFSSHISDDYMNINMDRHLDIGKKFNKQLYGRATNVLAHGEIKVLDDEDLTIKENRKIWLKRKRKEEYKKMMREGDDYNDFLDDEIRDDEVIEDYISDYYDDELDGQYITPSVNLEAKNILTVDSVLHRKNNYNKHNPR